MLSNKCYHCGKTCITNKICINNFFFCCYGCLTIYKIFNKYNLFKFYELNKNPGISPEKTNNFYYLDTENIYKNIVYYYDNNITIVKFKIPSIHCSSCIWLLENLNKIENKILKSTVNFTKKNVNITYKNSFYKLSDLAKLLTKIGYKPSITYGDINNKKINNNNYLLYKIVISFFCFGNIMLLSFPEYLGSNNDEWFIKNKIFFKLIKFILSIPIISFSSIDYFQSAFLCLKHKYLNIDIPISIGILVLYFRSIYEIIYNIGSGYFDSLSGLVFFILLGKYLQLKTYKYLSFENNYKYYYPIYVTRLINNLEETILISNLKKGDDIIIKNNEIIPADSILMDGLAMIDNSFITGESNIKEKKLGDYIYAGAKQKGGMIKLKIIKNVNKSYLNNLWINEAFRNKKKTINIRLNLVSKYFTILILIISLISGIIWYYKNINRVFEIISSILIVACPCGLALSTPFIFGNVIHILGKKGFYIRDISIIERISKITYIIFDKTGTITEIDKSNIKYFGQKLDNDKKIKIISLLKNSNHPLCKIIYNKFSYIKSHEIIPVTYFEENPGKGIKGLVNGIEIKAGKYSYISRYKLINKKKDTKVFISFEKKKIGYFLIKNYYRNKLQLILKNIGNKYKILIMSGDNDKEKKYLKSLLPYKSKLFFFQSPMDKLNKIKNLQKIGEKILMFGDGINDSLALKQSDVGIVISNNNSFCQNCDIIMDASSFEEIPRFLKYTNISSKLVLISLIISIIYNLIGLLFAITGHLTPIISAILMPLSFISVIIFSILSTWITAYKLHII
ncbi:heavy metal translocating P-type ATPase [Candidatus Karelsulcia muelleri]|uniref:Cation transport ATPase, E1-E2 family protein n=1 Tax=Candidatus Karelsulcia muelleri PSPU TaxID=1189303 RepID=A0AAD1AYL5_9FLAO|nr:HAD-IC family P-type ATPase [Candidatus Karelsulcia muelleri]NJJ98663.1 heavy metal translocating P-type ATPase [Candidatus Karelsulcia muelleri]BAO66320.1 cation transport ATPase, E1-E2 family protein [Candidatus Karelsulcia muelleri PSPU]